MNFVKRFFVKRLIKRVQHLCVIILRKIFIHGWKKMALLLYEKRFYNKHWAWGKCQSEIVMMLRYRKILYMKYKRWIGLGGSYDLIGLVKVARNYGMKIIVAFKPALNFHYEIGLYGDKEQIEKTDKAWRLAEHKVVNRKPVGACGFDVKIPREEWAEKTLDTII